MNIKDHSAIVNFACPTCKAPIGEGCRLNPKSKPTYWAHDARRKLVDDNHDELIKIAKNICWPESEDKEEKQL